MPEAFPPSAALRINSVASGAGRDEGKRKHGVAVALRRELLEQRLCLLVLASGDIGKCGRELEARIVGVQPQRFLADWNGLEGVDGLEGRRPFPGAAAGEQVDGELLAGRL